MNNLDTQIRSAVTERTAEWLVAHRAAVLSERENAEFFAWLKTSPMHVEEYLALAALEGELHEALLQAPLSLEELRDMAQQPSAKVTELGVVRWWREAQADSSGFTTHQPWMIGALAAAALGLGIALWWVRLTHMPAPQAAQTYLTKRGEQASRHLEDGSTLELDTSSAITVRFSAKERHISLDHGQALFEVAHDTSRPFRVVAGDTTVTAIGTKFDVYRRADATLVTVLEGRVAVTSSAGAEPQYVGVGEQLEVVAGEAPRAPSQVDATRAVAWLTRQIVFNHRPLGELADEFNRYNGVPVIITDQQLRNMPISGVFNLYDIDSLTAFLASLDGVSVHRSAQEIRVSRSYGAPQRAAPH